MARDPISENALLRKALRHFEAVRILNDKRAELEAAQKVADDAFADWQKACYDAEGGRADIDYPGGDPTVPNDADANLLPPALPRGEGSGGGTSYVTSYGGGAGGNQ